MRRFGPPSWGPRLTVYVASLSAAVLVVLLILTLGAITDLVASRGNLTVDAAAREAITQRAGPPDRETADHLQYVERGLLPTVWRLHDTWLGPAADALFMNCPSLDAMPPACGRS